MASTRPLGLVLADAGYPPRLMAILTAGSLALACGAAAKTPPDAATAPDVAADRASPGENAMPDRASAGPDLGKDGIGDTGADVFQGCSPGTLLEPLLFSGACVDGRCICSTYDPDGGTLVPLTGTTASTGIVSYQLPQPTKAGQPYTFSFTYSNRNFTGDLQLWGSTSECGPGLQMLFAEPVASKVYCATVHPTADYPYLLFVENHTGKGDASSAASNMTGLTACPTAACP